MLPDAAQCVVEPYTRERINQLIEPYRHTCTWREHNVFRNAILRVLRCHGTVGPMGEAPITASEDEPDTSSWPVETSHPDFFVVDVYWGEFQRDVLVETEPQFITQACLLSLSETMARFPYRSTTLGVFPGLRSGGGGPGGQISVFGGRLLVDGPLFENCRDLASVVAACQKAASTRVGTRPDKSE